MVTIKNPEDMNLLGLLLGRLLERSLLNPRKAGILSTTKGRVLLRAGRMKALLDISEKEISIEHPDQSGGLSATPPEADAPLAQITGTIPGFMSLTTRRVPLLPLLTGKVRARGNPFLLIRLARIFRPAAG